MPLTKSDCAKGGRNQAKAKRTYSRNPELAREAGRKGGQNAQKKLAAVCKGCGTTWRMCVRFRNKNKHRANGWDSLKCCPECCHE